MVPVTPRGIRAGPEARMRTGRDLAPPETTKPGIRTSPPVPTCARVEILTKCPELADADTASVAGELVTVPLEFVATHEKLPAFTAPTARISNVEPLLPETVAPPEVPSARGKLLNNHW